MLTSDTPHRTAAQALATLRVLVALEDQEDRATLARALAAFGHTVGDAANGRNAVERAVQFAPDAVLLDVHVPGGAGIEAAAEIARALPEAAIVLLGGDLTGTLTDRDVTMTSAIAFLPTHAPAAILESTIRLAVSRARELASARQEATAARQQLENRKTIERAKGILMRRTGTSEQEAYRILQRTSQDRSVPMVEIAKAVLASEPGQ
jgi:two-component system, response regulator PdtaR